MQSSRQNKPCTRCLLSDTGGELYATIRDCIAALPPDQRADDITYRARLQICRSCEHLLSATCTQCGCYIELRAAKAHQTCPAVPRRWGREDARGAFEKDPSTPKL